MLQLGQKVLAKAARAGAWSGFGRGHSARPNRRVPVHQSAHWMIKQQLMAT